jgi:trehalose 6-phosphate phosphatase
MSTSLPSALDALDAILARSPDRTAVVFLDYDGTLTPIVPRPEDAVLAERTRAQVRRLARCCPVTIVSGRDREVVECLVGLPELGYVGSHGFDIAGPAGSGIRREVAVELLPELDRAEAALRAAVAGIAGALVERKRFTIAAHFRLVAESDAPAVERAVDAVLARHPGLRKAGGKKVFELRPALDWDKGRAVLWLLDALDAGGAVPIHVGDDLTDETVFEALRGRGVGVVVGAGARPTEATHALADPAEVAVFVERLAAGLTAARLPSGRTAS